MSESLELDYDLIAAEAKQRWWGPCLGAVLAELDTCKHFARYLEAIIAESSKGKGAAEALRDHCDARARIDLPSSLVLAIRCLQQATGGHSRLFRVVKCLTKEYFNWKPNNRLEDFWLSILDNAKWQVEDDYRVRSDTCRQLAYFVNRLC